jgi:predicted unusual protein kinase regulating ubiquinone biosynthesis (AarF/ABC1/UbiB family)
VSRVSTALVPTTDTAVAAPPRVSRPRQWARTVAIVWSLACYALPLALEAARERLVAKSWVRPRAEPESARLARHGARLRERLLRLGPTFIKTGQMLATRADLLPVEFLRELAELHDRVPPFPDAEAFAILGASLGRPVSAVFSEMSDGPVAAASLGQVYRARLRATGEIVAVKIRRPALARRVALDMRVMERLATWAESLERRSDRFAWLKWMRGDWVASVHEFDRVLAEEMDYRREAASAVRFAENFASWPTVHVPRIHEEFTSERVIVMEFIEGIKVTDVEGLRAAGYNPRLLNERLYRTYFKQLFEDGFFHADPHPGNLLVMKDGRLAFFDFGMVGVVDEELRAKIVAAFFHLLDRDIDGLIGDLFALDFLPAGADVAGLHDVVAEAFARRLEVKLSDVRFREIVYDLAPVVYEYPFTTPARFTFLIRALMTLEGISVVMNPDFNFFDVAGPYARDFLFRRGAKHLRGQVIESLRDARTGHFDWGRVWRLAKSAYSLYAGGRR